MIPWKNPDSEVPPQGHQIFVLTQHPKKAGPLSVEIFGCEAQIVVGHNFSSLVAINKDYVGRGWQQLLIKHLTGEERDQPDWERIKAWVNDTELNLPEWLVHKKP